MDDLSVEQLKEMADDLSIKWNAAKERKMVELQEEIGDNLYQCLEAIQKKTGEWYRPVQEVDNL
jgi:hypothetical protein